MLAALCIAPATAALACALVMPEFAGLNSYPLRVALSYPYFAVAGLLTTAIFGLPAFFILRRYLQPTLLSCAAAGAFVAACPWLLITILPSGADEASMDGHVTVLHGHNTVWQYIYGFQIAGLVALFGLVGGVCFWAVIRRGEQRMS